MAEGALRDVAAGADAPLRRVHGSAAPPDVHEGGDLRLSHPESRTDGADTVEAVADVPAGGRSVTVVMVDDEGVVVQLPVLEVATPWWQEVDPIVEAFPGLAVLRLLSATPAPGMVAGGKVTYLAERLPAALAPATSCPLHARRWPGRLHEDDLRLPWAAPGGPAADLGP